MILYCSVPWKSGGIDEDLEEHETYLNKFRKSILEKLKTLINKNLEEEPELKSRKKIVQVISILYNNFVVLYAA